MRNWTALFGLIALLAACASNDSAHTHNPADEFEIPLTQKEKDFLDSVPKAGYLETRLIIARARNEVLADAARSLNLIYSNELLNEKIKEVDAPYIIPIDTGVGTGYSGGVLIPDQSDYNKIAYSVITTEAENLALSETLSNNGTPVPDYEKLKEAPLPSFASFAGSNELGLIPADGLDDIPPDILEPDEKLILIWDHKFRAAYRADPKATLDLIRRILGSGEIAK